MIEKICKICGKQIKVYNTLQNKCPTCAIKAYKHISKHGKRAEIYDAWRDTIAKPYLDNKYGHVCKAKGCGEVTYLQVDHIKTRGSRPDLKMDLKNVRYLCDEHHRLVTDGKIKI